MKARGYLPEGIRVPNHVAVIPDGNRRWAKRKGLPTLVGHQKGFDRAVELTRVARNWGIHTLTLWFFSTENWKRAKREVEYLMRLASEKVDELLEESHKYQSRIVHLGRKDRLPRGLRERIAKAEEETRGYKKYVLNIGLDYNGRDEIRRGIQRMVAEFSGGEFQFSKLTEKDIFRYLDTRGQKYPEPDLIIRTSGELRYSGILMYQGAYAEFYFEKRCFPDFTVERLRQAIIEYSKRQRRFGGD